MAKKITTAKELRDELLETVLRVDKRKMDLHEVFGVLAAFNAQNELYYKVYLNNEAEAAIGKGA